MDQKNNKLYEIRKLEQKLNDIDSFKYVKTAFISSLIPAIIAWFFIGTLCYDEFGYENASGLALLAGISVPVIFVIIGIAIAEHKKNIITKQINDLKKPINTLVSKTPLLDRYSNSEPVKMIINKMTDFLGEQVIRLQRPQYLETIETYVSAGVFEDKINYSTSTADYDYATFDFEKERKPYLLSDSERRAMAQAIAEGVRSKAKKRYSKDINGKTPDISITYEIQPKVIHVKITYKCKNTNYKQTTDW